MILRAAGEGEDLGCGLLRGGHENAVWVADGQMWDDARVDDELRGRFSLRALDTKKRDDTPGCSCP